MNNIIFKGVSSTNLDGLLISELPPITKPAMRTRQTAIDGRDGSVIEELGYQSYNKPIIIGLYGNYDINKIIKYFSGEGEVVFSNEPDKVYKARIVDKIDFERLVRYRKAKVIFLVQPFKYKKDEAMKETEIAMTSGTSVVVNPRVEEKLAKFSIHGKTTQSGTPTPSASIALVSLGVGKTYNISINDNAISFENALRGIAVTDKSLETYTDASGQMWCADEIDLVRGVYVKRIEKKVFNGAEDGWWQTNNQRLFRIPWDEVNGGWEKNVALASHFVCNHSKAYAEGFGYFAIDTKGLCYFSYDKPTLADFKSWLSVNNVTVICPLKIPVITPLTEEQIAWFNSLDLSKTMTITNEINAHMSVGYFKPFEVFNEGLETSRPLMLLKGSGTVEISVNGVGTFSYTFPDGENEVYIDSETEDAYLGNVLKNRNMNGEFPILQPKTNIISWSGNIESIEILPRSRWL